MPESRTTSQRKADVLDALSRNRDAWLATADRAGRPHLIAVSSWWDGQRFVVATTDQSRSARNLEATHLARLALGSPDDVIVIDAQLEGSRAVREADGKQAEGFAAAVGWDPRDVDGRWSFYELRPRRIQAYRGYDELEGRDVMRDQRWLA
jgi:hypothetical protein